MSLVDLLNQSNFDFYFLCVDKFLDIDLPQLKNFYSLSAEKLGITLEEKNSGRLLSHPVTQKYIIENSKKSGRTPAIIPFKPSAKIDLLCQKNNWKLIANPANVNRLFEDKIKFVEICENANIPIIGHQIDQLSPETYSRAQEKFGKKMVIQTHFGWAGNSTHFSQDYTDVSFLESTIVKFSPLLEGYSLLNNCCIYSDNLIQSPPALQYTGLKPFTKNVFATVGRQWPSFAPSEIINQVKEITNNFFPILKKSNYRGFFGLDFFVHQNRVFLLECNPRLTASFAFYTQLELNQKIEPLFFYHLASFIGIDYPAIPRFESAIVGSEVTQKDDESVTTKRCRRFTALSSQVDPIAIPEDVIKELA